MPDHHNSKNITPAIVNRLKQRAKRLSKETRRKQTVILEEIARDAGFPNWKAIKAAEKKYKRLDTPLPNPSMNFTHDQDVEMSKEDIENVKKDLARRITAEKKLLLARNQEFLVKKGVEHSVFEPTATGLEKSILDATLPVRVHFKSKGFHDYGTQGKGTGHKVITEATLLEPDKTSPSRMSIYRPETKDGDPRMWFRGLKNFAEPGDQVAIIILQGKTYLLNLSQIMLEEIDNSGNAIDSFLDRYINAESKVSAELLTKLKALAKHPIRALGKGDTAIGMAIEDALGVPPNSSKKPDYKGIELKSGRGSKNRTTLFAQVPNWKKSECKSSHVILKKYGYERDTDFRLYCTISTRKSNSQGLFFECDKDDHLYEKHKDGENVAVWDGEKLRERLLEKHPETFWIQAKSVILDGVEHFYLQSVIHTRAPMLSQLMPLIERGVITMDHLIKQKEGQKGASEKGPLFKINKRDLPLLFPSPKHHSLMREI
ncbi:hypothetical protein CI610_02796 [invertebrate metagenome]|uniref:MvaI/BcnI restriction endonuclease domain-containing protein n=1 Tax=invertebrate metagenome TaxID=1711999 RepID=A0A2H9T4X6_9ZZZZ